MAGRLQQPGWSGFRLLEPEFLPQMARAWRKLQPGRAGWALTRNVPWLRRPKGTIPSGWEGRLMGIKQGASRRFLAADVLREGWRCCVAGPGCAGQRVPLPAALMRLRDGCDCWEPWATGSSRRTPWRSVGWPRFYPTGMKGEVPAEHGLSLCRSLGRAGPSLSFLPCHSLRAALRERRQRRAGFPGRLHRQHGTGSAERQPGLWERRQRQRGSSGSWHPLSKNRVTCRSTPSAPALPAAHPVGKRATQSTDGADRKPTGLWPAGV